MSGEARQNLKKHCFRIVAQDPSVKYDGRIVTANVEIPAEELDSGPTGHRVQVVDFDASTETHYKPRQYETAADGTLIDPFKKAPDSTLLSNPSFHSQNVYAIIMRTIARFEFALGRRVNWGFDGHQLKVAPHAFAEANAFYSGRDEALMFGYFPAENGGNVFTCLSHDIIAHETTHALLDGLRHRYTDPSSPDQAGFHEGFADIVALLSVFSLPDVVRTIVDLKFQKTTSRRRKKSLRDAALISVRAMSAEILRKSFLFGLADEMGEALSKSRGEPLRASAKLNPSHKWYHSDPEFQESHRRGEILVAAVVNAFLEVWATRLNALDPMKTGRLDRERAVEEGARAADHLLTMCIRAIDYCPPVHVLFGDFLSALVTADYELHPNDEPFHFRRRLLASFRAYGIEPASTGSTQEPGIWLPPERESDGKELNYGRTHFESMLRDPEEIFRFVWENRKTLCLYEGAFTRVLSVRPCLRIADDGFALHETVAEYVQILKLTASELEELGIEIPDAVPSDEEEIQIYGGGVLIFDEYGRLKFHIHNRIGNFEQQSRRLASLAEFGYFGRKSKAGARQFSELHRLRSLNAPTRRKERWN